MALTDLLRFFIPISQLLPYFGVFHSLLEFQNLNHLFLVQMIIQNLGSIGYTKFL